MTQRQLLVTGGAGFIGANFVRHWCDRHAEDRVVVVDALTYAGNRSNLADLEAAGTIRFEHADINEGERIEGLLREEHIDTIVHFAAESHVDRSIHGPAAFVQANLVGTFSLLEAARAVWLSGGGTEHRFHHVSTDEVYGSLAPDDPAFREDNRYLPNSPYAASKAGSDHMVRAYHHTYGLQVSTSNCSNNYGPYQFPEKLIPLLIVNVLEGRPLPVYGDGRNVRDWLHVLDHCRGVERVIEEGRVGATYNVGGGNEWANIDLVRLVCSLMDEAFEADPALAQRYPSSPAAAACAADLIRFVADRKGHDRRYAIDGDRIADELGFRPEIPLREGLRSTIHWYLDNEAWWRGVMDGSYRQWVATNYDA